MQVPALAVGLLVAASGLAQSGPLQISFGGSCTVPDASVKTPVRLMLWHHDYRNESAAVVADVMANAEGKFSFDTIRWLQGHEWGWEFFVLHAQQGPNVAIVLIRGDEAVRKPLVIQLKPAISVSGKVTGPEGRPVANAAVHAWNSGDVHFAAPLPSLQARTDARGEFTLKGVPPGPLRLMCLAEPFALARSSGDATDAWDFSLEPGAAIEGRVCDDTGKPMLRARVCAQGHKTSAWATATTDAKGRYRLIGLVEDRYNVWADVTGRTCVAVDGRGVEIGATVAAPDILVLEGGFLVGSVVDADTGKPFLPGRGADVAIYGPSRPRSGAACQASPIAADGSFRIRAAPGDNYIYLRCGQDYVTDHQAFTLPVKAGADTPVEFRVRRAK